MAVFFDLDDTLLDHASALRAGAGALYDRVQPSLPFDAFLAHWTASLARHYDRYLAGELSYEQQRWERVREVVDATLSDAAADGVFRTYLEAYEAAWSLFPDVQTTLIRLSGHRLGIITNGQAGQQRRKLEETGLLARVECVVISEECGFAKPNPEIFLKACSVLSDAPDSSVYVGDRYDVDAVGARKAGLTGIWLDRGRSATSDHEPPIITTLRELPSLLARRS